LECGGKSPCVVLEDANLDEAVKWSSLGIFYNSGQNCTANSRILVEESVYDEFLTKFKSYALKNWTVGDPFDGKSTMGPLINQLQYDKVTGYIKQGAEVEKLSKLIGDEPVIQKKGYYVNPTIFTDVPEDSKLYKEEIFGPVAVITKFKGFEDGLKKANNTIYGLGGSVFSKDIKRAHKFANGIRAGVVMINSSNDEDIRGAFGGFKMSGIGRELGLPGIETYTQTKTIYVNLEDDEAI
jgi:aldehyde dehydrogenase (NAD(P)+)